MLLLELAATAAGSAFGAITGIWFSIAIQEAVERWRTRRRRV